MAKRPAEANAPAESEAKKSMCVDAETAAGMLLQGVVRVLQSRLQEWKAPLPLASLEDEFKALQKMPFLSQWAGENDAVSFYPS